MANGSAWRAAPWASTTGGLALFVRDRGAGGQHIELSMADAVVSFLWADAAGNGPA